MIKITKTTEVVKSVDLEEHEVEKIILAWAIANGFSEKAEVELFGYNDGCYISERHFECADDGEEDNEE